MSKIFKFSPLLVGVIVLVAFLIYLNWPQEQGQQGGRAGGLTPVVVQKATNEAFPIVVEALGTAVANESVNITAQQAQTVTKVLFEDGAVVKQGQLLVELNNRAQIARLNELNINLTEAKRQLERIKGLAQQSAASEQLLDEQQSRVQSILAQREVAKANLQELTVSAPFSGRLGIRQVSIGSLIRPGDTITTLDDLSIMKVDFSIAEVHLSSVQQGQRVFVTSIAYPGEQFEGQITNIESRIDPQTRSIQVRAQIPNKDLRLRPGMLMQINLEKRVLNALVVPESALVPQGDEQFVFVVNGENKAIKTLVVVGERKPGWVQITSGLNAGQKVITQGTLRVRDGSPVRLLDNQGAV
ncbi:efflux RND transporter periplasmic adaptor subunit [Glaciecola petra]|uniref:Efflux RND transporter periplasmic adaptor subunit n=1 Tax=Glaciecola petra TaxID=3075602 RepID=A0ABU2ZMC3_9ALTE|nr:efflux RND transporter periplasmic adaptor subunit [Aestuariibacter sp. P117]MDT0593396.1 efflux RND transporter periplasmic adaptor subunit [Aestuariibacter sp. P117]